MPFFLTLFALSIFALCSFHYSNNLQISIIFYLLIINNCQIINFKVKFVKLESFIKNRAFLFIIKFKIPNT
jgi:hypothetical protein